MERFLAAAMQIDSQSDKSLNLSKVEGYIDEAAARGAALIGMPEMVNYIGDEKGEFDNAESLAGETISLFSRKARQHKVWLHCGSIFEKIENSDKLHNTSILLSPAGEIAARYRKIHLFDVNVKDGPSFMESKTKQSGEEIVVAETELGNIGLSICYDMRFPELYRIMMLKKAQIVFVPAEYTLATGKDHWEPVLRTRAIENQMYIIAPAQIGIKPGFPTYGRSLIIDPWGNVIAKQSDKEGIIIAEIDLSYLESVRKQVPCLSNRRPDLYNWNIS